MAEFRTGASEFPNDNPELHEGAVWIQLSACGRLRAVRRPSLPAAAAAPAPSVPVTEPAPAPDGFAELAAVLARVALDAGATRAAAVLPALLAGEDVDAAQMPPEGAVALEERGLCERKGSSLALSPATAAVARTWQRALRSENVDLGSCESTLDDWCAELLSAILGAPAKKESLRRELRSKGVVAFGFLAVAA